MIYSRRHKHGEILIARSLLYAVALTKVVPVKVLTMVVIHVCVYLHCRTGCVFYTETSGKFTIKLRTFNTFAEYGLCWTSPWHILTTEAEIRKKQMSRRSTFGSVSSVVRCVFLWMFAMHAWTRTHDVSMAICSVFCNSSNISNSRS